MKKKKERKKIDYMACRFPFPKGSRRFLFPKVPRRIPPGTGSLKESTQVWIRSDWINDR